MSRIILALLMPSFAQATEGFFAASQMPLAPEVVSAAFQSAVSLRIQSPKFNEHCSGVFISNQGHVLTALHCVLPVLPPQLLRSYKTHGTLVAAVLNQTPIRLYLNTVSTNLGLRRPQVVLLGKGAPVSFPSYEDRQGLAATNDELKLLGDSSEDFAILKFELPALQSAPCIEAMPGGRLPSGSIFSIGFPEATHRPQSITNAPGSISVWSHGRILRSFAQTQWGRTSNLSRNAISRLRQALLPRGYFLNDLDGNDGSSGQMILNNRGQLVAITTSTTSDSQRYYEGLSFGLSISLIQGVAGDLLESAAAESLFHCH